MLPLCRDEWRSAGEEIKDQFLLSLGGSLSQISLHYLSFREILKIGREWDYGRKNILIAGTYCETPETDGGVLLDLRWIRLDGRNGVEEWKSRRLFFCPLSPPPCLPPCWLSFVVVVS